LESREVIMAAQVKILFHAMFKEITGKREITRELSSNTTLKEVLDKLAEEYGKDFNSIVDPKTGQVSVDMLVMVNGQSIRKTDTQLKDKDVIMISIPVGGG
jgi:MoaD family protein